MTEEAWDLDTVRGVTNLSSITTLPQVQAYVVAVMKLLTFSDVKECVALATGVKAKSLITRKTRKPRKRDQTGGSIRENTELMTEFLAVMDSVHDFGRGPPRDSDYNLESLTEILDIMGRSESFYDPTIRRAIRSGVSETFERELLKFLRAEEYLVLGGKLILNTLRRCDLLKISAGFNSRTGDSQYKQQRSQNKTDENMKHYEIWSFKQQSSTRTIIEFKQLLEMHQQLNSVCGTRSMILDTYADADDEIMRYVTAMDMIHQVTLQKFDLRGAPLVVALPNVAEDEVGKLHRLLQKAAALRQPLRVATHRFATCDANIFDAARTATPLFVDARPTGIIPECKLLELKGARDGPVAVDLKLSSVDVTVNAALTSRITSKQSVIDLLDENQTSPVAPAVMQITRPADMQKLRPVLTSLSKKERLGLKRAGDWSQVEYCKKRNNIFVTRDRLAALYAFHRKTRFIFYRNLQEAAGFRHVFVCYNPNAV